MELVLSYCEVWSCWRLAITGDRSLVFGRAAHLFKKIVLINGVGVIFVVRSHWVYGEIPNPFR